MSVGKAIYSILNSDSPVNTAATGGIYPDFIPQGKVPPFIAYRIQDSQFNETKDGVSSLDEFDITVVAIAKTTNTADDLAIKIRTALDGYDGTANGVVVDSIFITDKSTRHNEAAEMMEIEQDFTVRIKN